MSSPCSTNSAFPFRLTSLAARLALPLICLSAFSPALADPPTTQPQDDSLAKTLALCKQLIDHGKQRDAFPQLSRLHDAMDPKNPNPVICALMARTALLEGRADMAAQFIDPWSEHPPTLHPELTTAYLAACDTMLAQGHADKSLTFFNWIASNVDSASNPEDMALATEGYGISSANLRDIDEAIRACHKTKNSRAQNKFRDVLHHYSFAKKPEVSDLIMRRRREI